MQDHFYAIADSIKQALRGDEIFTCWFSGEHSDFVRFNHGKIRQAGDVLQRHLSLRLIVNGRQAKCSLTLSGENNDFAAAKNALIELRNVVEDLPADPYLLYAETVNSSDSKQRGALPLAANAAEQIVDAARDLDLVGIYAAGPIYRGFANSFGQRNWHESDNFNFEWSLYHQTDKAVKTSYAGSHWRPEELSAKIRTASDDLEIFRRPAVTIAPGEYRAYLAPRALEEIIGMLSWGGLSMKARRTKQSPLIKMEQGATLSEKIMLRENTADAAAPGFQGDGFLKPPNVTLINSGRLADALIAPRSAREYGLESNGANGSESPESADLAAGTLASSDILNTLDTGLTINNLWYLNYSDRPACRMTGMTRFATFWVEQGKIVAPVNVMRFDDTIYRMLGENLVELTQQREVMLDASTYGSRTTQSARLPGALLGAMRFTL